MTTPKSLEDREIKARLKLREFQRITPKSHNYLCTNCESIIIPGKTKLVYFPRRERLCPHCGHAVIKTQCSEARKFIADFEKRLQANNS